MNNKNWNTTASGNSILDNGEFSYSLSQSWSKDNVDENSINGSALNATYKSGQYSASLGYSNYYHQNNQLNWGLNGAIVAHPYGVTLSQELSSSSAYAIVKADNASDVKIKNHIGVSTDWRGYAIIPYITGYRENQISLDSTSLGNNKDFGISPVQTVIPTKGAFVVANYNIKTGFRGFLTLTYQGKPLPFGTNVQIGDDTSLTDENGQVYLTGMANVDSIIAQLPNNKLCRAIFIHSWAVLSNGIYIFNADCRDFTK